MGRWVHASCDRLYRPRTREDREYADGYAGRKLKARRSVSGAGRAVPPKASRRGASVPR